MRGRDEGVGEEDENEDPADSETDIDEVPQIEGLDVEITGIASFDSYSLQDLIQNKVNVPTKFTPRTLDIAELRKK